jgi:hypothetical protein
MDRKFDDEEVTRFLAAWFEVRQFIQAANFNHFHKFNTADGIDRFTTFLQVAHIRAVAD